VRIGILGGTFNPPHLGHLVCAQEAYIQLHLERVVLIPARQPPHKPVEDEPGAEHRLELAVAGDPRFEVSEIEFNREGPSYTVDTLSLLHASAPDTDLHLILGGDIAAGLPNWHEPERVLSLATVAVAERRGTATDQVKQSLAGLRGGERTKFFHMPGIGVSSTLIRERVRGGQPVRYLVPDRVESYIADKGLYR
jgi:nicotinate-nucleotide adenylyltransferase